MPEIFIYEYDALAEKVQNNYKNYIEKPKKDGTKKKEVDFRWHDTKLFTKDDLSRKNNWSPIIKALKMPNPTLPAFPRGSDAQEIVITDIKT